MHTDHVSILWRPAKVVHDEVVSEAEYAPEEIENDQTIEPEDDGNVNTIPVE